MSISPASCGRFVSWACVFNRGCYFVGPLSSPTRAVVLEWVELKGRVSFAFRCVALLFTRRMQRILVHPLLLRDAPEGGGQDNRGQLRLSLQRQRKGGFPRLVRYFRFSLSWSAANIISIRKPQPLCILRFPYFLYFLCFFVFRFLLYSIVVVQRFGAEILSIFLFFSDFRHKLQSKSCMSM